MNHLWKRLKLCKSDLQLDPTLNGGQSFRWKKNEDNVWIGVLKDSLWMLSQTDDHLLYQRHKMSVTSEELPDSSTGSRKRRKTDARSVDTDNNDEKCLQSYFRLDVDLKKYYEEWCSSDPNFKEAAKKFYGIRILNQDLMENLFSFICSSNNNITRISSMVEKLCVMYGNLITTVNEHKYYTFPSVEKLTGPTVESDLRKAGFGYRAKFIYKSSLLIEELGGSTWVNKLKTLPYHEAKLELMKLPGIGAKVADCICLMSLGHLEAVPVDTHVFQIASQKYLPHLKSSKSVTEKVYNEIGDYFRRLYGSSAGWAHTILFCSDLKMFRDTNETLKGKKKKK